MSTKHGGELQHAYRDKWKQGFTEVVQKTMHCMRALLRFFSGESEGLLYLSREQKGNAIYDGDGYELYKKAIR
ncbi:hypothetical protein KUL156_09550 [Alteromonas sp. KUL156]|nr:hypothetical protein KUL154_39210 [Alteromonas sp. KUL154]GFD98362.1 hypothetical protein KUL156_09550 [Alteromonas sp. KUL156]